MIEFLNNQGTDTVGLFSARQSKRIDDQGCADNMTISAIQNIQFITAELSKLSKRVIKLNPYLLADSFSYPSLCIKPYYPGETFDAMSFNLAMGFKYYDIHYDKMKLLLLYMRLHQFCSHFPNKDIKWHVYEDRFDILDSLYQFIATNPEFVPSNVEITFYQYGQYGYKNKLQCNLVPWQYKNTMQGTGNVEFNYNNIYYYFDFVMEKLDDKECDFTALLKERIRLARSMPYTTRTNSVDFLHPYNANRSYTYQAERQHWNRLDHNEKSIKNLSVLIREDTIPEAEFQCFS